jgi:hypothetical protein
MDGGEAAVGDGIGSRGAVELKKPVLRLLYDFPDRALRCPQIRFMGSKFRLLLGWA